MKRPKPIPMICPTCRRTPESYFGRLVFPEEMGEAMPIPKCPHHPKVALVPVQ